jgi:hypothetical protein
VELKLGSFPAIEQEHVAVVLERRRGEVSVALGNRRAGAQGNDLCLHAAFNVFGGSLLFVVRCQWPAARDPPHVEPDYGPLTTDMNS